jgi:hypothetical protein
MKLKVQSSKLKGHSNDQAPIRTALADGRWVEGASRFGDLNFEFEL